MAAALAPDAARAQAAPETRNPNILFDYYEPRDPRLIPLYERLQSRRVLEELSEFLAPVKWTKKIRLIAKECPATQQRLVVYAKHDYSLTICYQWFAFLRSLRVSPAFGTQQQIVVGGLVGFVLHEAARAAFDVLKVPVLGAEAEAADQISAYIALQFGEPTALAVIKGTYLVWKTYDNGYISNKRPYDFVSSEGVPLQRAQNVLCIAYGGASGIFKAFVDQGDLLSTRSERCPDEYRQVAAAFQKTIVKHVDEARMKKALTVTWLTVDDLK
jgi:hypothetical protein